ncbi:MAG: hypothetical protein WHU94_08965, partial [Thermogemmata sp.]
IGHFGQQLLEIGSQLLHQFRTIQFRRCVHSELLETTGMGLSILPQLPTQRQIYLSDPTDERRRSAILERLQLQQRSPLTRRL